MKDFGQLLWTVSSLVFHSSSENIVSQWWVMREIHETLGKNFSLVYKVCLSSTAIHVRMWFGMNIMNIDGEWAMKAKSEKSLLVQSRAISHLRGWLEKRTASPARRLHSVRRTLTSHNPDPWRVCNVGCCSVTRFCSVALSEVQMTRPTN